MVNALDESKEKQADIVITFLYTMFIIMSFIQRSMLNYTFAISNKVSIAITFVMLLVSLAFKKHNVLDYFWLIILSMIVLMNSLQLNTSSSSLICTVLIVFSLSNVDPKKILSVTVISISVLLLWVFLLSKFGIIENLIFYRNGISRQSLGMIYPLTFSGYLFFLAVAISMLWGQKHPHLSAVCLLIILFVAYFVNQARNDSLMIILLILAIYVSKYLPSLLRFTSKFYIAFMAIIALLVPFITDFLKNGSLIYSLLDKLASGRLYLQSVLLSEFKPTLFGQYIYENGNGGTEVSLLPYFYIDSAFTKILFFSGVLFFIAFVLTWLFRIHSFNRKHLYFLSLIFLIVWIDGITEESLQLPEFNILFGLLLTNVNKFDSIFDSSGLGESQSKSYSKKVSH